MDEQPYKPQPQNQFALGLLLVLLLVGLFALAIPAVMAAREAARRTRINNSLKQVPRGGVAGSLKPEQPAAPSETGP